MHPIAVKLDLPFSPHVDLIEQLKPGLDVNKNSHYRIPVADRDVSLVKFLRENDLYVFFSEIFYTSPNQSRPIHVDGGVASTSFRKLYKINWIYGGRKSFMAWYMPIHDNRGKTVSTVAGTRATQYDIKTCVPIYRLEIDRCGLVDAGIPHTVYNFDEPRWAVSYLLTTSETNDKPIVPSLEKLSSVFEKFISKS